MSITEFQRHQIFQWFEETMGPERAAIMMDLLPPVGWGDIATSRDLAVLRAELRAEMAELRNEMHGDLRALFFAMVASNATLVGLVVAAVRLV